MSRSPDSKNTADAVKFLNCFHPEGPHHLVAIALNGHLQARTFASSQEDELYRWIEERQGKQNLYFHVNRLNPEASNKKAKKADISEAVFLHVDVDDPRALDTIKAFEPRPTAVVSSGGGFHAYWRIDKPCDDLERIERCNLYLASQLGGDNCQNVDRIMRLPDTVNLPNKKKRSAGRTPALAYLVDDATDWGRVYSIDIFPEVESLAPGKALSVEVPSGPVELVGVDVLPSAIPDFTRTLIECGDDPERPRGTPDARYPSRSEAVYRVTCDLVRGGCADEVIAGILLNPQHGISESIREKRDPKLYAFRQIVSAQAAVSDDWPDVTKTGKPRATLQNAMLAVLRFGLHCEYDEFHNRKIIGGHPLQSYQGELSDDACAFLRKEIIEKFGFDPGKDNVREAANTLCLVNRFHPIREYLDGLKWDGKPRIDQFLSKYFGAQDTPLNRAFGRKTLIAAVRRVRQPGAKFDTILVLEGPQGSGKSTAISILAGEENFSDQDILTLDSKSQMEAVEGVWLYEICELEGISRAETNKVKAFASRRVDRGRPAYGRFREDRPRQTVFIGTTNDTQYLRDQTGNRRFWPVETGEIDLESLKMDRDQIWAEAQYWEAKGESIVLPEELWAAAADEQELRLEGDPWLENLSPVSGRKFGKVMRVSTHELLTEHLQIPPERQQQYHSKRVGQVMRKLGWSGPKSMRVGIGRVVRGYDRPVEDNE